MDVYILIAATITIAIILWVTAPALRYRRTILGYFWGNKTLEPKLGAHLLWSGSLSLNGMFYHTWLGYQVGIYSLFIQIIWVCGFLLLIPFLVKGRLKQLVAEDTLHGNIGTKYGRHVQLLAVVASILTFVTMSAWELSVFEGFVTSGIGSDAQFAWGIPVFALLVAFAYTIRGGLIFNSRVNAVFGFITFLVLGIAAILLVVQHGWSYYFSSAVFKWDWAIIGMTIGWLGFTSNALFSLFWQTSEMSTWQNLTAVSEHPDGIKNLS
uniref:Sodium:solute symporter family protein n=1 Tax=Candidatus Kentrum sp. LPFa TaxID=2126335 RepID=A0A450WHR8_9GAMM|nr:MAG: hypothetical protein BECKLPF1236B_GA0070989_109716 [Candidatus Kentron sp. LPFa]